MFRKFRAILPRDEQFVARFCEHSDQVVAASLAFRDMLSGDGKQEHHYAEICRFEEQADDITKQTLQAIHRSFITPFDRSQIHDLITALDDTVDLMKETGRRIRRYHVEFTPGMLEMGECVVRAAQEIRDAMPCLNNIHGSLDRLYAMQMAVRGAESKADELLDAGLQILFDSDASAGQKLAVERVYDLIESVVDRCEDVTDVIEGIVIEQV